MKRQAPISVLIIGFISLLIFSGWWFISANPSSTDFSSSVPDGSAARPELPAIINDLPDNIEAADVEFNRRVKERYPDGMRVIDLVGSLSDAGFVVSDSNDSASVTDNTISCTSAWTITWTNNRAAMATNIEGSYIATCL